jgi:hypothetical protein
VVGFYYSALYKESLHEVMMPTLKSRLNHGNSTTRTLALAVTLSFATWHDGLFFCDDFLPSKCSGKTFSKPRDKSLNSALLRNVPQPRGVI